MYYLCRYRDDYRCVVGYIIDDIKVHFDVLKDIDVCDDVIYTSLSSESLPFIDCIVGVKLSQK